MDTYVVLLSKVFTVIPPVDKPQPGQSVSHPSNPWMAGWIIQSIPLKKHAPRVTDSSTASNQLMP